jgi:hypothetical protein
MKLNSAVAGIKPSSRYTATDLLGQVGTSVGFGIYGTGTNPGTNQDGRKRAGSNIIDLYGDVAYASMNASDHIIASDFDDPGNGFNAWGSPDPLNNEMCTSSGDSGGAVFVGVGPRVYHAAVHSFVEDTRSDADDDSDYGDTYGSTRDSFFNSWVDDNITVKWANAAGGAFATSANWTGGVVPNATDVVGLNTPGTYNITFAGNVNNDRVIARSGNVTLALAGNTWTLSSETFEGSLIVGRYSGNNASLTVGNGTLATRDLVIAEQPGSTGTLTIAAGGALNVTGGVPVAGDVSVAGDVYVGGSFVAPGGKGTLNLNAAGVTNISGLLRLYPAARVNLAPGANKVVKMNDLAVDTAPGGGKLDLGDNKLIVHAGSVSTLTTLIQSGRNGGGWGGNGIVTSQTAATTGNFTSIGIATAQQVKNLASASTTSVWAGQTVTGSDSLVMYTYGGDANLDGKITVDDYGRIDFNVGLGTSGWFNGDFNYDGKVTVDDYGIIDFNVGIQGAPFPTSASPLAGFADQSGLSAVPEPSAILLATPAALLLARRKRRR